MIEKNRIYQRRHRERAQSTIKYKILRLLWTKCRVTTHYTVFATPTIKHKILRLFGARCRRISVWAGQKLLVILKAADDKDRKEDSENCPQD